MAETNVILKYRRPQDSWLCPECDSENTLSYSNCSVCGFGRGGAPVIVKAWSEMDERPPVPAGRPAVGRTPVGGHATGRPPVGRPPMPSGRLDKPVFVDHERASGKPLYVEKESHAGRIILWTIAAILMIILAAYYFVEIYGGSF